MLIWCNFEIFQKELFLNVEQQRPFEVLGAGNCKLVRTLGFRNIHHFVEVPLDFALLGCIRSSKLFFHIL